MHKYMKPDFSLGNRLRNIRVAEDKTQKEFAEILGVSVTSIANYESEKRSPDCAFLEKLYELYEVNLNWLVAGEYIYPNKSVKDLTAVEQQLLSLTSLYDEQGLVNIIELLQSLPSHLSN